MQAAPVRSSQGRGAAQTWLRHAQKAHSNMGTEYSMVTASSQEVLLG